MPVIRILNPTPYSPQPGDSPRCYGPLRLRPTEVDQVETASDGTTTTRKICGPMEFHFPAGSMPEVSDELAARLVAAGAAEFVPGAEVVEFVSRQHIIEMGG